MEVSIPNPELAAGAAACWVAVYLGLNAIGYAFFGHAKFKGYTQRSYFVGCVHEGFMLPSALALCLFKLSLGSEDPNHTAWLGSELQPNSPEWHVQLMLIGYLGADLVNFVECFDASLLVHHVIASSIAVLSLLAGKGAGYAVLCIVLPEFGSLWLNICDIWPSRLTFLFRLFFYVGTRIVAFFCGVKYWGLLSELWQKAVLAMLMVAIYAHNSQVAYKMAVSLIAKEFPSSERKKD